MLRRLSIAFGCQTLLLVTALHAADIGTAFTYQGTLENGSGPVTDTCDFRFGLWDDPAAGAQVGGSPVTVAAVDVVAGTFTAAIDFGTGAINGTARWLEIEVQCPGDAGFTLLSPRVELSAAPHALALPGLYTLDHVDSPSIVGGSLANVVTSGAVGVTIGGGGAPPQSGIGPQEITDNFGTIAGGRDNRAGNDTGTTSDATHATVGGGSTNIASATYATVAGGGANNASAIGATVAGGFDCDAVGDYAVSTGGFRNQAGGDYSLAAGKSAWVRNSAEAGDLNGDEGTFVWADSTHSSGNQFVSTGPNQFLIGATGGVGIGTNAPTRPLTVAGVIKSTTGGFELPDGTVIDAASDIGDITAVTAGPGLTGGGTSGSVALNVAYAGTGVANTSARSDHYHSSLAASDGSPSDAVVVDANGNVGIGMDPTTSLSVLGAVAAVIPGSAPAGSELTLGVASSDPALILERGDGAGNVAQRWDIAIESNNRLEIRDTTAGADRIVIDNSGRVAIGTGTPSAELHVVGDIVYTGTITDISDERLKENIAPVENAISKIQQLRGVYFNMTDSPDVRDVGLIAQDVQAVLPEAVSVVDPEKGYLGVAYPSVIPLLVEAIKEQDNAIAAKNCEIESLDSEISNLKSEIDELKSLVKALADRQSQGDEQ